MVLTDVVDHPFMEYTELSLNQGPFWGQTRVFPYRKRVIASTLVLVALLPSVVFAQSSTERVIWRSMLGSTAFDLRARQPGVVRIGVADEGGPMTLEFRSSDVRKFTDSATKVLSVRRRRPQPWSVRLEETGARNGALSLSFTPGEDEERPYRFFASDDAIRQVRESLTADEARLLVRHFRSAAASATPPPPKSRQPNAKRRPGLFPGPFPEGS